jgi:type I restriction enzyme S subunit
MEVTLIPKDWQTKPLKLVSAFISKGATPTTYGFKWTRDGVLFLRSECVSEYGLDLSQSMFISPEAHTALMRGEVRSGDILMTITGNVGRVIFLDEKFGFANTNQHIARIRIVDPNVYAGYIYHYLSQSSIRKYYSSIITGQAYPQISLTQVRDTEVPIPPLKEQEAIATALSDADALIEALEQLIAKKRLVKQGAMQELLTGKRRLSGFTKKWETKKLGDVFEIAAGGDFDPTQSSDVQDERFPYPIYSNALTDKGLYGFSSYNNHQAGSITVTARGTLGKANYREHDFTAIGRVIVLKPIQPLDGRYIAEFINNRIDFVVESTGVPQLTAPQISKYEILFPEYPEQTAIAEILSDMDAEIAALEGKLSKARQVKQGMMQELLTGRVRLV